MALPSGLPDIVDGSEHVTRFARFSGQYFKADPKRPKPDLFEPAMDKSAVPPRYYTALSVSRTSTQSKEAVRELGEKVVSQAGQQLRGWCNLNVQHIRQIKSIPLDVVAEESNNNHFHAHIEHMPEKPALLEVMNELADIASDMMFPKE